MEPSVVESLHRTARGEAGLPSPCFGSAEFHALEVQRFFRRQWFCAGLSHDVALPGDWRPLDVLGQSLQLARDTGGRLHAFHNVCSHRGSRLLDAAFRGPALACPYHAWTYDTRGQLLRTPHAAGAGRHDNPDIERSRHGLREVGAAERGGLVFVTLEEPVESFESRVGPLFDRWGNFPFDELEPVRDLSGRQVVDANWKIVVENFVESYHLPRVHPELNRVNPMSSHYQILGGGRLIGQGSRAYGYDGEHRGELPFLPGMSGIDRMHGESLYLPPNLLLIGFPDFLFLNILSPLGPTRTSERLELLLAPDAARRPDLAAARANLMQFLVKVNLQDVDVCAAVQRGRGSESFTGGVFVKQQEETSLQFQQVVASCLLELPPAAMTTEDRYHPPTAVA